MPRGQAPSTRLAAFGLWRHSGLHMAATAAANAGLLGMIFMRWRQIRAGQSTLMKSFGKLQRASTETMSCDYDA